MDEELMNVIAEDSIDATTSDSEHSIDIDEAIELVNVDTSISELEHDISVDEPTESVDIEDTTEVEIEIGEAIGWTSGDSTRHYSLNGRDEPNQHPIAAITGLRDELDEIERLKTVYSDKIGAANYYEWSDGAHDEYGYFVSLVPHTSSIQICSGTNVFGVTVESAGFVGGQGAIANKGNTYGLVATSGVVDVRCESNVTEEDYVVSNATGVAKKTTSNYGYKVIAVNEKHGVLYAAISLGVQASVTDSLDKDLKRLDERLTGAETNIVSAINVANQAYKKSSEASESSSVSEEAVKEALEAILEAEKNIEDFEKVLESTNNVAVQAKTNAMREPSPLED